MDLSHRIRCFQALAIAFLMVSLAMPAHRDAAADSVESGSLSVGRNGVEAKHRAEQAYGRLPLRFEANRGQGPPGADFIARGSGFGLLVNATGVTYALEAPDGRGGEGASGSQESDSGSRRIGIVKMKLARGNRAARADALDMLGGETNYFRGRDSESWVSGVSGFAGVRYNGVYRGVDVIYRGDECRRFEYDFVVAPGADSKSIRMEFEGIKRMSIDESGDLVLTTDYGELRHSRPVAFQESDGKRVSVDVDFVLFSGRTVGFKVGTYDRSLELVIDPLFSYSTYLGGTGFDGARGIAIDAEGHAYVVGETFSFNFPTTLDAFSTTFSGLSDAFVTKLNPEGSNLVYSTFIGGAAADSGQAIAVDAEGNAFIAGFTSSADFPVTMGSFQPAYGSNQDGFVTKLAANGSLLHYSTYLGGSNMDRALGIAIDSSGSAFITGMTRSANFPTHPATVFQPALGDQSFPPVGDAFVTKLSPDGSSVEYSTYLGGAALDEGNAIAVDSSSTAYVTGITRSLDFPVTPGAFQQEHGGIAPLFPLLGDAFVARISPSGESLIYSTYLGGEGGDSGLGIALGPGGDAFVSGITMNGFPVTPAALKIGLEGVFKSTDSGATWFDASSGISSSHVLIHLTIDPNDDSVLYALTMNSGGVYKSTDGGVSWLQKNVGLPTLNLRVLVSHPTDSSRLFLGSQSHGVFRTTNGGDTWAGISTGLGAGGITSIAIDPTAPDRMFAGTTQGIFRTLNGGANWMRVGQDTIFSANHVTIDPLNPSRIYANSFGFTRSTDGGDTWSSPVSTFATNMVDMAVSPMTSFIYAAFIEGVARSTNGGDTWFLFDEGIEGHSVRDISFSNDGGTIYLGTSNALSVSTDSGETFSPLNTGLLGTTANSVVTARSDEDTLYISTTPGGLDGFVARVNSTGSALVYSTYLGGSFGDRAEAVAVDSQGNAFVTGSTSSVNFPTTAGFRSGSGGFGDDAFVAKLNPEGSGLVYSTYLGGGGDDSGRGIAINGVGQAFVAGQTSSSSFPTTPGAFQRELGGVPFGSGADAFISKIVSVPMFVADLAIQVEVSTESAPANSVVQYLIDITNNGPDIATNWNMKAHLPSSLTNPFCDFQGGVCQRWGNTVGTGFVAPIQPGDTRRITISALVSCDIDLETTIETIFRVKSPSVDPIAGNNSAVVTINATNTAVTFNPAMDVVPPQGGNRTVQVNRGNNCTWLPISNADWITVTFWTGCCNGFVNYTVAPNPGFTRMGTITIAGETFVVNQAAGMCDTTPILIGDLIEGELTNLDCRSPIRSFGTVQFFADRYSFTVPAGERVRISLNATAFNTFLYLLNPDGEVIAQDDDGGGGTNSRIPAQEGAHLTLTEPGVYTIEVTSSTPGEAGQYTLSLRAFDTDGDGIPDDVELIEGTDPDVRDNDVFGNARLFVMQQYRDFLRREGDAQGITFWTELIESETLTRAEVIEEFFNSPEFQTTTAPITRLYFAAFLRIPDTGGLNFWIEAFRSGLSLSEIAQAFSESEEFEERYGELDNVEFVTLVYNNVLEREPDAGGLEFWVGQLESGALTRGGVLVNFSESAEYRELTSTRVFVTQIYVGMLRRAPDEEGFDFWVGVIEGGASRLDLIHGFLDSAEYHDRFLP